MACANFPRGVEFRGSLAPFFLHILKQKKNVPDEPQPAALPLSASVGGLDGDNILVPPAHEISPSATFPPHTDLDPAHILISERQVQEMVVTVVLDLHSPCLEAQRSDSCHPDWFYSQGSASILYFVFGLLYHLQVGQHQSLHQSYVLPWLPFQEPARRRYVVGLFSRRSYT